MSKKAKKVSYEDSVARLEETIARLEQGDMSLEEALQSFEEGVCLSRECQKLLADAERRVVRLTADGEEDFLTDE
ncbi:MAG: exodeoxyribonuclease VII small subunit [Proteobacteria bacterium]|nr:MAG: exodeoxyribonuclease VII small subunit [Pseudomonadota bacterium]